MRIQTDTTTDWLAAKHGPMSDRRRSSQLLTRITYKQYLMDYVGAPEEAIVQYQRDSHGLLGAGAQAMSRRRHAGCSASPASTASACPTRGAHVPRHRAHAADGQHGRRRSRRVAWPDGNTSLLRLLVAQADPGGVPGRRRRPPEPGEHRQGALRLHAARPAGQRRPDPAQQPRHQRQAGAASAATLAEVDYTPIGGKRQAGRLPRPREARRHGVLEPRHRAHRRRASRASRSKDLCYARKVPLIYGRAGLSNWQAFADAKISSVTPARQQPVLGQHHRSAPARASAAPTGRRRTSRRPRRRRSASRSSRTTRCARRRSRPTSRAASSCSR